ncbi:MAG: heat-inducible transcriptional repressor HrcA [Salinisphaeraceae bacterium]|nr:heat-inducible transcriptional repressor HrcA [Salinisphaeraceae bacterium]
MDSNKDKINDRASQLLKTLVEEYIRSGEPVGSRTLAQSSGMGLSSATIRNVMADLEDMGLVIAPHTSAGRIPTVQGLRLFVDNMLSPQSLDDTQARVIQHQLAAQAMQGQDLLETASALLSQMSHLAGLVTVPRRDHACLRQIEFLPLSDRRVLAILVVNQREVENRVLDTERDYSRAELERAANFLNQRFVGQELADVRRALVKELKQARERMDQAMADSIHVAEQALARDDGQSDYVVAGQTNLMGLQDFGDLEQLKALFEAFSEKRELLRLFDNTLVSDGVRIFIGDESGYRVLDGCSVVTAPYSLEGEVIGSLGVIGPTRMDYRRIIPIVQSTAAALGSALKTRN